MLAHVAQGNGHKMNVLLIYSLLSLKMICFDLFPYASEPSMNFNILELVSYDFIIFFWLEKRLTGAVNIFSGVSKNRFRQTHHSCNDVEQLIILRFYNRMPTTSYFSPRSSRRHQIIYRVLAS